MRIAPLVSPLVVIASLSLLGACATTSSAVPVAGSDIDVALLAGHWEGTYEGLDSGRKGTLTFDLAAGYRLAEGKVVMNALGDPAAAKPLTIKFVDVGSGQLSGKMEPYSDPRCNCTVDTEFVGAARGKTIEGTFTTRPGGSDKIEKGRWSATRK